MRKAFTLMELMVAISIITIAAAIVVPLVNMSMYTRVQAAEQTVSIAGETARRHATQDINFEIDIDPSTPGTQKGKWTGAAAMFTQDEVRIIETDPHAVDAAGNALSLMSPKRYGYRDMIGRDYITIPRGSGVVGVVRTSAGLKLIAPPFAVRFNHEGNMVVADKSVTDIESRWVFYDGDYDGAYNIDNGRTIDYTPELFDSTRDNFTQNNGALYSQSLNKIVVPIERMECVIVVLVYDKEQFRDELMTLRAPAADGYIGPEAHAWLMERGKTLTFNRSTGRVMR